MAYNLYININNDYLNFKIFKYPMFAVAYYN